MRRLFPASASLVATTIGLLAACQHTAPATAVPRQVKSIGYGTVTAYPDCADLTVDVSFTKPALKDAVTEVQAVVDQVLMLARQYATGPNDVRVSSTSSNKEVAYTGGQEIFAGYNATQSVTVRIIDLRRLSPFLEGLLATRINRIRDLRYSHSRADSLCREAAVLALADASKTADKMCAALHVRREAVLGASDAAGADGSHDGWSRPAVDIELYGKGFGGRGFQVSPGLLRFESTCTLTSALD